MTSYNFTMCTRPQRCVQITNLNFVQQMLALASTIRAAHQDLDWREIWPEGFGFQGSGCNFLCRERWGGRYRQALPNTPCSSIWDTDRLCVLVLHMLDRSERGSVSAGRRHAVLTQLCALAALISENRCNPHQTKTTWCHYETQQRVTMRAYVYYTSF